MPIVALYKPSLRKHILWAQFWMYTLAWSWRHMPLWWRGSPPCELFGDRLLLQLHVERSAELDLHWKGFTPLRAFWWQASSSTSCWAIRRAWSSLGAHAQSWLAWSWRHMALWWRGSPPCELFGGKLLLQLHVERSAELELAVLLQLSGRQLQVSGHHCLHCLATKSSPCDTKSSPNPQGLGAQDETRRRAIVHTRS